MFDNIQLTIINKLFIILFFILFLKYNYFYYLSKKNYKKKEEEIRELKITINQLKNQLIINEVEFNRTIINYLDIIKKYNDSLYKISTIIRNRRIYLKI